MITNCDYRFMVDNKEKFYHLVLNSESGHLPTHKLKEYRTYRISSRSSHVGIWLPERDGFIIWRQEYGGSESLMLEYHWDILPYHTESVQGEKKEWTSGTVKPFFEIEKSPFLPSLFSDIDRNANLILDYLKRWCVLFPESDQYEQYWQYIQHAQQGLPFSPSEPLRLNEEEVGRSFAERKDAVLGHWGRRHSRLLHSPIYKNQCKEK